MKYEGKVTDAAEYVYAHGCTALIQAALAGDQTVKFPASEPELLKAGYILERKAICRGSICGTQIHWYKTPAGRMMPLSKVEAEPGFLLEPHWTRCADLA